MRRGFKKRGQIWVETVIYTLIAFSLIGLVLGVARPRIQEQQDKSIIEQSVNSMQEIDSIVNEVRSVPGNKRVIELGIRNGLLRVDGSNDKLVFELEGSHTYSEPGSIIRQGNLMIVSEEKGRISFVNITRDYSDYNLTYQGLDTSRVLNSASTPYSLVISNEGKDSQEKTVINIDLN